MRNLLVVSKVYPGADSNLDSIVANAVRSRDLLSLVEPSSTGRGLLYWASWYDPWLTFKDVCPDDWGLPLKSQQVGEGLWTISLSEGKWSAIKPGKVGNRQWMEGRWLVWQLRQAWESFRDWNEASVLLYGREVLGNSLDDQEVAGVDLPGGACSAG